MEIPFLTGQQSYPEPDSTVEGGMIAKMSPLFPNEPIDLGNSIKVLPTDGTVPHMPDFRWIHTPDTLQVIFHYSEKRPNNCWGRFCYGEAGISI